MNLLSYNCQGLGNNPTVVSLKKLLAKEDADVAVLVETKLSRVEMEKVVRRLGDYTGIFGESIGRKAGVAIIWRQGITVEFISSSAHHVDVAISEKDLSWQLMRDLKTFSDLPWLLLGDFNQILYDHEKKGGRRRPQGDMDGFRQAMDVCDLINIGYARDPFTWWNKRGEPEDIFERLDRGLAFPEWLDCFPALTLSHLERDRSDHLPIKLSRATRGSRRRKAKSFRFEDMWVESEDCESVIADAWGDFCGQNDVGAVVNKIKKCGMTLTSWSREEFGSINKQLTETRKRFSFLDATDGGGCG
ncbi:hypothetical protein RND81_05G231500 [Saponaria officinalis]|uniref:Endonuclease/exonuclease/phosphatase domain-containing protein n=1 Tax=Saponaria officinalis TaxID=3572 RepID=A0AAW1L0W0_SAPOF